MLVVIPGVRLMSLAPRSEGAADVELRFLRSVRLSELLWCLAGPKCVSLGSPLKGELLKAVLMPLTCMQRQGEMCRRQKGLA